MASWGQLGESEQMLQLIQVFVWVLLGAVVREVHVRHGFAIDNFHGGFFHAVMGVLSSFRQHGQQYEPASQSAGRSATSPRAFGRSQPLHSSSLPPVHRASPSQAWATA